MFIAVDFDGTCVVHDYPSVGEDVPGAAKTLLALQSAGHRIILYTMRNGTSLDDAVEWFSKHGIRLFGINSNPEQPKHLSNKVFADIYIDDSALGCPIDYIDTRRVVDWRQVWTILASRNFLPTTIIGEA